MPVYDFGSGFQSINGAIKGIGDLIQDRREGEAAAKAVDAWDKAQKAQTLANLAPAQGYNPNGATPSFVAGDLSKFAVGGAAARTDSFTGMQPQFSTALASLVGSAPPEIQQNLKIASGYRSPEVQAKLWQDAVVKYGSPEAARKWVAPPGNSQHNHGFASDLKYASPEARKWAHANAGRFGLAFPLANEPWHVELAGVRGR